MFFDAIRVKIRNEGGTGVLTVDGKERARKTIPHTIPFLSTIARRRWRFTLKSAEGQAFGLR